MKMHELKTWPNVFPATAAKRKTAEFRKNDRVFRVGDLLKLREWYPESYHEKPQYSGKYVIAKINHILGDEFFGIPKGYVVMSIEIIVNESQE